MVSSTRLSAKLSSEQAWPVKGKSLPAGALSSGEYGLASFLSTTSPYYTTPCNTLSCHVLVPFSGLHGVSISLVAYIKPLTIQHTVLHERFVLA